MHHSSVLKTACWSACLITAKSICCIEWVVSFVLASFKSEWLGKKTFPTIVGKITRGNRVESVSIHNLYLIQFLMQSCFKRSTSAMLND